MKELINAVVEARAKAEEAAKRKTEAFIIWRDEHQDLIDNENATKNARIEAEDVLRELAIKTYAVTGDKAVAPGIGIRVMTRLNYESKEAMEWAVKHELALKLDTSAFEKIAKTNNLPFVNITEEPLATIATDLQRL